MIQRIKNKPLINDIKKYDAALLIMNINNSMPDGFLREVAINFPSVKEKEIQSGYGDRRKYGDVYPIEDVIQFYACYAIRKGQVDDVCLEQSLEKASQFCKGKKVATVLTGDEEIYKRYFQDSTLYLYDDVNIGYNTVLYKKSKELRKQLKEKQISREMYEEELNKLQWERFHGIHNKMPEGWKFTRKKNNKFKLE